MSKTTNPPAAPVVPNAELAAASQPALEQAPASSPDIKAPAKARRRGRTPWFTLFLLFAAAAGGAGWYFQDQLPPPVVAMAKDGMEQFNALKETLFASRATEDADKAKKAAPQAAPAVSVIRAEITTISEQVIVSGSLVPRTEVLVAPEVEGLSVREIRVDEGDTVRKGDVLAVLNPSTLELQMIKNKAEVARAEASIAQAKTGISQAEATKTERDRSLERTKSLRNQGFASSAQLDQNVSAAKVSEAQLNSSKKTVDVAVADKGALMAAREDLEWRMARTEIVSPVDGVISRKSVRVGQIASGAGDAMFRIIANGDVELEADVADIAMPRLTEGMKVAVTLAGGREIIDGDIRLIRPEIDPASRLGKVRVRLKSEQRLIIGSSARGLIETGSNSGVSVPLSAISFGKDRNSVQVVVNDTVKTQIVKLGLVGGDRAEVLEGLDVGAIVVVKAGTFLKDGDKVRAMPLTKDPTQLTSQNVVSEVKTP
jgi:HlyD family secretion protein